MHKLQTETWIVHLTFEEELLGTACNNPDLHGEYIASKAPDALSKEEELASLGTDTVKEKGITIFPKTEDDAPFLYDYQIKGFFKDACGALRKVPGTYASKIKAYKKEIDGLIFVSPRKILLHMPENTHLGCCQRPLRASGPQGERVAISYSETAPAGTTADCSITCLTPMMASLVEECLDYGALRGLGQWRNSGKGRFSWEGRILHDDHRT